MSALRSIPTAAKAVAAFASVFASGTAAVYLLTPDVAPTVAEWVGVAAQSVIAAAAVYMVPNRPTSAPDDEPKHLAD